MADLRAARPEDVAAIAALDPHSPRGSGEIQALIGGRRRGVGRALMRAALRNASTPRVFTTSTNESIAPMRELLRREGWTLSGILTGLDEGDPEHVFLHDSPAT